MYFTQRYTYSKSAGALVCYHIVYLVSWRTANVKYINSNNAILMILLLNVHRSNIKQLTCTYNISDTYTDILKMHINSINLCRNIVTIIN